MYAFSKVHPTVQFIYYICLLMIVLAFQNPFISAVAFLGGVALAVWEKRIRRALGMSCFMIAAVTLFNFLFAHYGVETLFSVKGINFTLNALLYGVHQGVTVAAVLLWLIAFSRSLDSEKFLYIFRFAPKFALMFSMVLGFIPRFLHKQKAIREATLALHGGQQTHRFKSAVQQFSALVTYALESSIITADSMRARAYHPKAQRAGRYTCYLRDKIVLICVLTSVLYVIWQKALGNLRFVFEPQIYIFRLSVPALLCFCVLAFLPSAIEGGEHIRWKQSVANR